MQTDFRVDAVASMLFLDYSREDGTNGNPTCLEGEKTLEAIAFMREMNEAVYSAFPDVQTIAEESTSFPMVSKPTYIGGLGFGMKWMMGWMHDTLQYFCKGTHLQKAPPE
jgi:1,4-alpha-glucan branching enzyme